ncbi:uncharacterized protein LOC134267130 [Saccostrea cucullata]|uniref:uncharacterized protein LOC134267130 n=1 Tax=Saccostrea cuccullata TaxID=36930 RepID=UPI002ED207E0
MKKDIVFPEIFIDKHAHLHLPRRSIIQLSVTSGLMYTSFVTSNDVFSIHVLCVDMAERAVREDNYVESEVSEDELSLDLSCGSSSFDENIETDPNSIAPFRFEPYASSSDEESVEVERADYDDNNTRLQNTEWCTCGNCIVMPTAAECVCCQEVDRVHALLEESENAINCITFHPGFHPACLNVYVLQIAYYQYRQQYNESIPDSSEMYRYTAYRQLARWAWGYLGKKVRVVLPSCAVAYIRNTFPSGSGHYTGFKPG